MSILDRNSNSLQNNSNKNSKDNNNNDYTKKQNVNLNANNNNELKKEIEDLKSVVINLTEEVNNLNQHQKEQTDAINQTTLSLSSKDRKLLEDIKEGKKVTLRFDHELVSQEIGGKVSRTIESEIKDSIIKQVNTNELNKKIDDVNKVTNQQVENLKKQHRTMKYVLFSVLLFTVIVALISSFVGGVFDLVGLDNLYNVIGAKIKASEGFVTLLWYLAYIVVPLLWTGIFAGLGVWLYRKVDTYI